MEREALAERVALVTGANRGIGFEVCRQLLAVEMRVALTGRDERAAREAVAHVGAPDDRAVAVQMDVTDVDSIARARREIGKRLGPVNVLVNNAAILLSEDSDVLETPAVDFARTFETNVFGAVEVCRVFVPDMVQRRYGRIVNVSSGAGQLSRMNTYAPAYSMSKAALNAFTRILASTHHADGVLVNAVDPGWVRTDMGGAAAPRSLLQGADTIVWLATLPNDGPTGGFFRDRRPIPW